MSHSSHPVRGNLGKKRPRKSVPFKNYPWNFSGELNSSGALLKRTCSTCTRIRVVITTFLLIALLFISSTRANPIWCTVQTELISTTIYCVVCIFIFDRDVVDLSVHNYNGVRSTIIFVMIATVRFHTRQTIPSVLVVCCDVQFGRSKPSCMWFALSNFQQTILLLKHNDMKTSYASFDFMLK